MPESQVLRTQANLPDYLQEEQWGAIGAICSLFAEKGLPAGVGIFGFPQPEEQALFTVFDNDDRTISLNGELHLALSSELLLQIKSLLADRYPLHRVVLSGREDRSTVVIYPDAIVFERDIGEGNLDAQVEVALALEKDRYDATAGARKARLEFVMSHFSNMLNRLNPGRPLALFRFNNIPRGDQQGVSIWFFSPTTTGFSFDSDAGFGAFKFEVAADGELFPHYELGDSRIGYLLEIIVPTEAVENGKFAYYNAGIEWVLELPESSDPELKVFRERNKEVR